MPITTYIVEDNLLAAESMEILLRKQPDLQNLGISNNKPDAVKQILAFRPDILFLDINLGSHTGFDIIDECLGSFQFVVFTTAYDEFAIQAFNYNTLHYLLKPIDEKKVNAVIQKIHTLSLESDPMNRSAEELNTFKNNFTTEPQKSFYYFENKQWKFVDISKVIYLKGEGSYCSLHLADSTITVSKNLKHTLPFFMTNPNFVRIHKSFVINKMYLQAISKGIQSKVILTNNIELPISNLDKVQIFRALGLS